MGNASIPPSGRFRQRPIDEQLRSQLPWQCQNWRQFMDRRRHLHPRQLGGNPNNGNNDTNGKIGTDGRNETNEYRFPEPPSHFANFFASQAIVFLVDCAYRH